MLSRSGVRVRAAATAALVVGLALVVAGFALVLLLDRALRSSAASEAEFLAGQVAIQLAGGSSPAAALRDTAAPLALVQVLGGDGACWPPPRPWPVGNRWSRTGPPDGHLVARRGRRSATDIEDTLVVAAAGVATPPGIGWFWLGSPFARPRAAPRRRGTCCCSGVPVLVLVAGLATYLASGRRCVRWRG